MSLKSFYLDELTKLLNEDSTIEFYHLVKFDLSKGGQFLYEDSLFKDKASYVNMWAQGMSHLPQDKRSFINLMYHSLKKKYSIHLHYTLAENSEDANLKLDIIEEDRDIFVTTTINAIPEHQLITIPENIPSSGNIQQYLNSILVQDIPFNEELNKQIITNIISLPTFSKLDQNLKIIFERLLTFLYPTTVMNMINYSVFVIPSYENLDGEISAGGAVVFFKPSEFDETLKGKIKAIKNRLISWSSYETIDKLTSTLINSATRAAISQVMARNMSHNIGSHVLSKLLKKEQIDKIYFQNKEGVKVANEDDVNKILTNEKVFYQCLNLLDQIDIKDNKITTDKESNESLLATFFHYLKARMDFLADVTTNTPVIENTKGIYNDIVKPFISNRILNDRISGIDNFKYKIVVCQPPANKNEHCINHTTDECHNTPHIISASNDIPLSIPNDLLGSHAFYTILENIIRNTAKHGTTPVKKTKDGQIEKDKDGKDIPLTVEFKIKVEEASIYTENNYKKDVEGNILYDNGEPIQENMKSSVWDWNEFKAISIFDNCDLSKGKDEKGEEIVLMSDITKWTAKEKEEAGLDKSCNEIPRIQELVIKQNRHLNDSILKDNQLRHGAWGLIEMDASAAYLRKIPIELVDSDKYQITCLQGKNLVTLEGELAIMQAYAEQEKYLGYRFFIRKPLEILIIADDEDLNLTEVQKKEENKKQLFVEYKNAGVWIYNKEEFKSFFKDNKQKVFPYKLMVLVKPDKAILALIEENKAGYTKRYFTYPPDERISFDLSNINRLKESLWGKYFNTFKIQLYTTVGSSICKKGYYSKDHGWDYCTKKDENQFIEIGTSSTEHYFSQDFSVNDHLFYKYSWPVKISVIDERIQSFLKERYKIQKKPDVPCFCDLHKYGVGYNTIYRKTNVFVPEKDDADLNSQNFDNEYEKIIDYIHSRIEEQKSNDEKFGNGLDDKPCDFIIVHMGIIEKLISSNNNKENIKYDKEKPEDIEMFIKGKILNNNIDMYDSIVITSGRGKPHNLPGNIRYLNFSVVSNYLITLRNKFALTEALYSARKQN